MSSLVLYEWKNAPTVIETDPDYATIVRVGEKVFVYGEDATKTSIDLTNIGIILKKFGKAKI